MKATMYVRRNGRTVRVFSFGARGKLRRRIRPSASAGKIDTVGAFAAFSYSQKGEKRAGKAEDERQNAPTGVSAIVLGPHAGIAEVCEHPDAADAACN